MKIRMQMGSWLLASAAAVLSACGGGGDSAATSAPAGNGSLRVALTDAPACGYDEVNVSVQKVRVHQSPGAADDQAGWSEITLSPPRRVNLLELTNGVLEELGSTPLPAGHYGQLRLVLAANTDADPFANSVVPSGGTETALSTPSAQQSGLKMNADIDVAPGEVADVVLDFDACKSVVRAGQSGRYNLKPVVSILPRVALAGLSVEGQLSPSLAGASVSLQHAGVVSRATVPDASGRFVLSPVPAGSYDLVISAEGRVTAVMTGVPVLASAKTVVNPVTAALDLPVSAMRSASGLVSTIGSAAIPDALVRVSQTVGGTPIELFARPVDTETGAYSASLPVGAPLKTAYVAGATSFVFTPDSAAAGIYAVEASVPGKTTQGAVVDLKTANATVPFAFAP